MEKDISSGGNRACLLLGTRRYINEQSGRT